MQIYIDQSNKIEKTNKDTVIGLANDKTFTILISGKLKRKLQEDFRKLGKPRLFVYRTFIAGVALLLKHARLTSVTSIIIDREYKGHEGILRSMFLEMWTQSFETVPEIDFRSIGRQSKAHTVSYLTMKGRQMANVVIQYEEIRYLALKWN